MSFKDKISQNIKESRENNSGGNTSDFEQIDVDMGAIPFIKLSPTTLVQGTFPEDEGNPIIRFPDEKNEGRKDQGYLGLVMEDITVNVDDEDTENTVVVHDEDDSTDYRIFNTDDDKTEEVDGVGVKVDQQGSSALYDGEVLSPDEFGVDRAIVVVSGSASTSVARRLDVKGQTTADMAADGDGTNGGLIEINNTDEGPRTRYARNPELKEDLYGAEVGVMLSRREEVDDEETGYVGRDGNPDTDSPVLGGDEPHDNPYEASYAEQVEAGERRSMYWYTVFNMETGDIIEMEDTAEPERQSYLEWRWDPNGGPTLSEEEQDFVDEYLDEVGDTDEDTIRETLEAASDEFDGQPNTEAIVAAIQ